MHQYTDEDTGATYFTSEGMRHFVFAEQGSPAGDKYNGPSRDLLYNTVKALNFNGKPKARFWSRLLENMEKHLKTFFVSADEEMEIESEHLDNSWIPSFSIWGNRDEGRKTHKAANLTLTVLERDTDAGLPARIVLANKENMVLSTNVLEVNGHLIVSYLDQFIPNILPFHEEGNPNKLYLEMDLMDAYEHTSFRIDGKMIYIKGKRVCEPLILQKGNVKFSNITKLGNKKCGKFSVKVHSS